MPEGEPSLRLLSEQPISGTLQAFAAVARHFGVETTADQMSRTYVFGEAEPSNGVIAAIARDLGLEARGIRVKWNDLPRLAKVMPAVLRLRGGGALVLEGSARTTLP